MDIYEFFYRGPLPGDGRPQSASHVVLMDTVTAFGEQKQVVDPRGPISITQAEKEGFPLSVIGAWITASAIKDAETAAAAQAAAEKAASEAVSAAAAAQQQAEADRDAAIAAGTTLLTQLQQAQTQATASATQATDLQSQLKTAGDQMTAAATAIAQLQSQLADAVAQIAQLQALPVEDAPPPPSQD